MTEMIDRLWTIVLAHLIEAHPELVFVVCLSCVAVSQICLLALLLWLVMCLSPLLDRAVARWRVWQSR